MSVFPHRRMRIYLIVGLLLAAPVVYWLASPLFVNVRVNESLPTSSNQQVRTIATGAFVNADSFHRTSGKATVVQTSDGERSVELTGFQTTNGPDLFVYLSTGNAAGDIVNLGPLKGNIGDQHYSVPAGVDLSRYNHVLIWCRTFSVLFGSAQLG